MKSLTLLLFWVALASCLFAQKEVIVKQTAASDKVVTVDVQKAGENERKITIRTNDDGEKQTIEWTDNGEIPEDIKKQLAEQGIDIAMIEGGDGKRVTVTIDQDGEDDGEMKQEVIVIRKGDDGEVVEYEWDGEGEMPAEMKELMEEHDLDIDDLHEGHGKHKMRKAKMRVQKDKMKKMRHREHQKGRDMKAKNKKTYKVVKIGEDGEKEVNVWVDDQKVTHDIHGEHDNVFIREGRGNNWTSDGGNFVFFGDDDDSELSDAYMGAHIESADSGARIIELIKDGPADKAGLRKGDIVERINGARARNMEGLLDILNYYEPNDKVELTVSRDGNERKIGLTLGQRPDSMK